MFSTLKTGKLVTFDGVPDVGDLIMDQGKLLTWTGNKWEWVKLAEPEPEFVPPTYNQLEPHPSLK